MARIIPLHGDDEHREVALLLPWYVTGRLDDLERARVETHLTTCAQCQAELRFERRLETEVAELPVELERGWAEMRNRITAAAPARGKVRGRGDHRLAGRQAGWMWGAIAAQMLLLLMLGGFTLVHTLGAPRYQTLGSASAPAAANVAVMFRPETSVQDLRRVLNAVAGQVVGGPTAAGAYLLHVPDEGRAAAVANLRLQAAVVLAAPIDGGTP
jgi:anti-sigma factor RsiW